MKNTSGWAARAVSLSGVLEGPTGHSSSQAHKDFGSPLPPTWTPASAHQHVTPPAVIPVVKKTYAEAAATPALERDTHVYVRRGGVVQPLEDNYAGPYLVLEKGPKVFKILMGEREEVVRRLWPLSLHARARLPGRNTRSSAKISTVLKNGKIRKKATQSFELKHQRTVWDLRMKENG